jgi:HD superfamily phosphodiesterase
MEDLKSKIEISEKKYLNVLSNYCQELFTETHIPSHDHTHHLRVWEYSKDIITALSSKFSININFIESCLIASLFHDTGLTQTLNENHGIESKKICESFFSKSLIEKPSNFEEILSAIKLHDDKDYKSNNHTPNSILSVICNADDLDAFGKIGVVRYTEIYLLRGINMNDLPNLVINNLDKRFLNFEKTYQNFQELFEKHKLRFLTTRKFFSELLEEEL